MQIQFYAFLSLSIISLFLFTSCSRVGFQDSNDITSASNSGNGNTGVKPPPSSGLADQVNSLDMRTYVDSGTFEGLLVADLDKTGKGQLILRIPLGITPIFSIGAGSHQKYKDISFSLEGSIANGFGLVVKIPLKYILRLSDVEAAAPGRLPNGDALPAVPSGELPMLNIVINPDKKEKIYLYLSKEFVGILFESKFDPGIGGFEYPLTDKNGLRTLGYFHLIPPKNKAPTAFMLLLQLPAKASALLDDYFMD
ncbi:MAG: hypothetical protein AABY64_06475 [Bdellovibrionota bacterium]